MSQFLNRKIRPGSTIVLYLPYLSYTTSADSS